MLDSDTKRRIDSCRDILVGKVPDPKSQVEQITIALIYKFMDDMDAEAEEFGGERKFFAGDYAKYGWPKLMAPNMGGFDVLALYSEAIQKMNENPGVPALFRDILKNAYLPYRDPETLRSFLKEINTFTYDHSERLGDAFEYLLSVLGSQGEAGQFRTPRNIIDFMVEIIDPKKDESILDPACGTAGFLISSYKHILKHNTKGYRAQNDREAYDEKGVSIETITLDSPLHYKGDLLTPDDRKRLATNIKGYDISPDMVRLSLVNMYLHGFTDPHIVEYDTLTSDERWNDYADIILANPPFMSPKGGIKPHKRFSVQATRSEVLFVDYIAEHLTPTGRAAVIVPEGIIFQSGTAYKQLRELLVKNYLVAVISLPAGVFNPYSGVKTSILVMDKRLSKKTDSLLFAKIENDGFNLGAQRRAIDKNDLPAAAHNIKAWLDSVRNDSAFDLAGIQNLHLVEKFRIGENGEWSLSGERYRGDAKHALVYEMVSLGEVVDILDSRRRPITREDREPGPYPYYGATGVLDYVKDYIFDEPLVLVGEDGAKWGVGERTAYQISGKTWVNNHAHVLRPKRDRVLDTYLIELLNEMDLSLYITGVTVPKLNQEKLRSIKIPLPPLDVQKDIVAEIEGYQKVIDGARQVVVNYQPSIHVQPDWPMVNVDEVCEVNPDTIIPETEYAGKICNYIDISSIQNGTGEFLGATATPAEDLPSRARRKIRIDDVLLSTVRPNLKAFTLIRDLPAFAVASTGFAVLRSNNSRIIPKFLLESLRSDAAVDQMVSMMGKGSYPSINQKDVSMIRIPLPDLDIQRGIVAQIEEEQRLVKATGELVRLFDAKVKATINHVWGEAK
ncbi:MAG: N-6 DNA methylase [Methylocystis sp.]